MAFALQVLKRGSRTSLSLLPLLHAHLEKNFHQSELDDVNEYEMELGGTQGTFELLCVVALSTENGLHLKKVQVKQYG